ncbi:MAG: glycosyltransferase family 2 protein [Chloroflexota bacterium]
MFQISVVLPTFNRKERLMRVISRLEMQSFDLGKFEVIVVSDGSTDGTNKWLQSYETNLNLRPLFQENQGVAATRNNGLNHAQARIVLFIDDDVVPHPDLLKTHYESHSDAGFKVNTIVIGPMYNPADHELLPWVKWEQKMLYKQYQAMDRGDWAPTARQFYTGNCSLHVEYIKKFGGFDPLFKRAEDVELAFRMADDGAKFIYNNQAIGYHFAERSFESWLNIPYAYGRNDVIFTEQRGQIWLVPKIMKEYKTRNPLIRILNWVCLDRQMMSAAIQKTVGSLSKSLDKIGLEKLSTAGYSLIFNLRHYQGMSDQLGGRKKFFDLATAQNTPQFKTASHLNY